MCFFVEENQIDKENRNVIIVGKDVNHIKNVLRCKIGEEIEVGVNSEEFNIKYMTEIEEISKNKIMCKIVQEVEIKKEADTYINIIQGLPKADKMELIIQKCTELGVKEITPLELKRCIVRIEEKEKIKKVTRWKTIAEVAAKQCGRNLITKINDVSNLKNLESVLKEYDLILVAYEEAKNDTLKQELKKINDKSIKIAVVIGPEGGFDINEIESLKSFGAKIITLGKRILRTETVAMVLSSIIMYEIGDLGGE